jgi:MFS family permease
MTIGSFWGIGPIFARRMVQDEAGIASFMAAVILGGLALQWPVGWVSDRIDRRRVIGGVCILAAAACIAMGLLPEGSTLFLALAVLLGGTLYPIYSLGVSHVNDFVKRGDFVLVSSGLLFLYGCGAALGPILAGAAMDGIGARGFPFYMAAVLIVLVLITLYRMTRRAAPPLEDRESSVVLPRTTPLILTLDPRSPTPDTFNDD